MFANNWKLELNRMLDSFANQAESSLDMINREFKAMGRSFDEDFRQHFLKVSNSRLDSSYTKIAMNHWYEDQIRGNENHIRPTVVSTGTSMESIRKQDHRMNNSIPAAESDGRFLLVLKNENLNDLIEIVDSEDERDFVQSDKNETITNNGEIVDENGSNASMQGDNDDGTGDVENIIKIEPEASVKFGMEDTLLPMVTFDPNRNSDESDATDAERGDVVPTSQKCQNRKSLPPPTKQTESKMERDTSKRLKCELCDYASNYKPNLKRHQKVHANGKLRDENNLYHCNRCTRQFSSMNHLSLHMKKSHKDGQFLYGCNRCMRKFVRKSEKDLHECQCNGRQFECHLCKVYFTRQRGDMQKHMRTHSGAKPFGCMVCDKFFQQKGSLRRHLNTVHSRRGDRG